MGRLGTRRTDLGAGSGPSTAPGVGERSPEPGESRERARRGQAENGPPGRRRRLVWAAGVLVALVLFGPSVETGTGTVVGHETVTVAGRGRDALHVRYDAEISGDVTGTVTIDRWYSLDRFPLLLREESANNVRVSGGFGSADYAETYTIELAHWEPQR